jgi:hypothetical protein
MKCKGQLGRIHIYTFTDKLRQLVSNSKLIICARARLNLYRAVEQGCQMVYFQTKNLTLGKYLRALL